MYDRRYSVEGYLNTHVVSIDVISIKKLTTAEPTEIYFAEYLERAFESVVNCSPTTVTGHPALSINAGFSDGLPVGMMIVGGKFDEATVLNVAYAYEKIRDAA